MANAKNPKVDAYIAKAAPFAQPILNAIRERVLASGVELEETLKWNSPSWTHEGKLLCGMGAFKAHCVFGFWHKDMQVELAKLGKSKVGVGGIHRERLVDLSEVPSAAARKKLMKKAAELALSDKPAMKRSVPKPEAQVPADLEHALALNKAAAAHFQTFTPQAPRVHRLDHRGQARHHAPGAPRASNRMDRRRQVAPLEVRKLLNGRPTGSSR